MTSQTPLELPEDDEQFIIGKAVDGYEPEEIHFLLKNDTDSHLAQGVVKDFLDTEYAEEQIEMRRRIQEKRADVGREELVSDLREVKDTLIDQAEDLRNQDLDDISNDTVSNLISNIKLLGEFIGELKQKDEGSSGTVNINKLEQNFNLAQTVQYLPPDEKKSVAEQLAKDEDVKDFVIVKEEE